MCLLMYDLSLLVLLHKSQFQTLEPVSSTNRLIDLAIKSSRSAMRLGINNEQQQKTNPTAVSCMSNWTCCNCWEFDLF